jgi:hypothetical protein
VIKPEVIEIKEEFNNVTEQQNDVSEEPKMATNTAGKVRSFIRSNTSEPVKVEPAKNKPVKREEDMFSGMELLELDFLLGVIENTSGNDSNDVSMRKLSFNELLRRQQRNEIDSYAMKIYAIDEDDLYGKDIQCEALKELAERTARR